MMYEPLFGHRFWLIMWEEKWTSC